MLYIGIDPGVNGGIAWMQSGEEPAAEAVKMPATIRDLRDLVRDLKYKHNHCTCALEKVASRPGQGARSTFTFGRVYGQAETAIICNAINLERVSAAKWQKSFSLITGKDVSRTKKKNQHKALAQELWPDLKITHAIADALLICEWWRRVNLAQVADLAYTHTGRSMSKKMVRLRHKQIMEGEK